jgi:hypothetical protein
MKSKPKSSAEGEAWFAAIKPPAEPIMRRVRDVILGADRRISEYQKYGSLIFGYEGDCVSFVQYRKPLVSLMFHRGARIKGKFPHLEGEGPSARFMRFKSIAEVDSRAAELAKIIVAWCDLVAPDPA